MELDSDIKEMYNEKIRGIHGETAKKSEGKFAVFVKELNMVYSRDVCDALMMVRIVKKQCGISNYENIISIIKLIIIIIW